MKRGSRRPVIGLFAEGSRLTDPHRDWFEKLWRILTERCGRDVEIKIFGISKSQVVRLAGPLAPIRPGATALIKGRKGDAQLSGGDGRLDALIARMVDKESLDRVVIAFDAWRPNQHLSGAERQQRCPMRTEIAFVLEHFARSEVLQDTLREAACALLLRYTSDAPLNPRPSPLGPLEFLYMDPMFEALFVSDQRAVLAALGFKARPKDWPKFRTRERALDKYVLDPAIECKVRRAGDYLAAKSRWGYEILRGAPAESVMWSHVITMRLCRLLRH